MNSFETRMECIRIASDTLNTSDIEVLIAGSRLIENYLLSTPNTNNSDDDIQVQVEPTQSSPIESPPTDEEMRDDVVADLLATLEDAQKRQAMAEILRDVKTAADAEKVFAKHLSELDEPPEILKDGMSAENFADIMNMASTAKVEEPDEKPKGRKKVEEILQERKEAEESEAQMIESILVDDDPERIKIVDDLVSELNPSDRVVMRKLLQKVETKHLKPAFKQYLTRVLKMNKD